MTKVTPKRRKKPAKSRKKHVAMNDARRKRALELIESGEFIVDVAEIIGVSRQTLYREKGKNKAFAKAWQDAEAIGHKIQADVTEQEMDFRGRIGWIEPKFFEGRICGFVRKYSDALLVARIKALDPARYGDKTKVEHSGADGDPITVKIDWGEDEGDGS